MNRKTARENIMKIMFQVDVNGDSDYGEYLSRIKDTGRQSDYMSEVLSRWIENRKEIDGLIDRYSIGWRPERMPKTDIAILREAVTEIRYIDDIPYPVTINEAVELAKKYGTEDSSGFINAVLGKVAAE